MMLDLLEKWAALEPDWCTGSQDDGFDLRFAVYRTWRVVGPDRASLARLADSLLQAIRQHDLRVRLQNSASDWHVSLLQAQGDVIVWETDIHEAEGAIALLSAYVQWLEQRNGGVEP